MKILIQKLLPIGSIAFNTFREALRNKVLGTLVVVVLMATTSASLLGELSLHEEARVTADGSLFLSAIFSVAIAVYSTVTLLHTEIERRTIYTILSKPIGRWQFLLGKFFGVALLLLVTVAVLCMASSGLVYVQGGGLNETLLWAFLTLYLQLLIVTSITLFFASFSSSLLSGLLAIAVFIAGNLVHQLEAARQVFREATPGAGYLIDLVMIALPNLQALNLAPFVTYRDPIPSTYLLSSVWYGASYSTLVLVAAVFIFSRRDFN